MPSQSPVIVLEFNELSPVLMGRFIGEGHLPSFERFFRESHVYTTEAEERAPYLDPWVQWITVHSGLNYREHGLLDLGDGARLAHKRVWDLLSDSEYRVWICGSMNASHKRPLRGAFLPDPWAVSQDPQPADLASYFDFVRRQVLEHTNESMGMRAADAGRFASFMARNGLSPQTLAALTRQLVEERVRGSQVRWKRAPLLDRLQLDVFSHYYRKLQPDFSTFFSNSTAHLQHMYWRNMEPQLFKVQPTASDQATYEDAILHGYRCMDRLVSAFFRLAGDDATLILCTALSQQACLVYEDAGGKRNYRPHDFERLLAAAGIVAPHTVSPVMAEQFRVFFEREDDAVEAEALLRSLHVGNRRLMTAERNDTAVFAGCRLHDTIERDALVQGSGEGFRFFDLFYELDGIKSGMHHPDGILWIRQPNRAHAVHPEKVRLDSIAPTLLSHFSVRQPAYMTGSVLEGLDGLPKATPRTTPAPDVRAA